MLCAKLEAYQYRNKPAEARQNASQETFRWRKSHLRNEHQRRAGRSIRLGLAIVPGNEPAKPLGSLAHSFARPFNLGRGVPKDVELKIARGPVVRTFKI